MLVKMGSTSDSFVSNIKVGGVKSQSLASVKHYIILSGGS